MTESEFQNFLKGLHIIDREIVDIAYLSTPDEDERKKRLASLLKKAEQLQAHIEEIERLWNEAAAKVEEGQKERLKRTFEPFEPFEPADSSKLPIFPVDLLPPVLRDFSKAVAESLQVPTDMPAAAVLGVVSACIQGKFAVQVKPDWKEQTNLYILVIARPSERKSPTLRAVAAPLYNYSKEENNRREPAIREYQLKREILEKTIASLKDRISKPLQKGKVITLDEISEKQRELESLKPVHPVRLIADDVTPEKLVSLMAANDGKMAVISAEGGLFDILAGLYNSNVNIDPFLKAYTGDSIQIDRQGRPSETIDNPALTMLLMIQPSVLEKIIENGKFNGRGLTARFLYSYPMSMVGKGRKFETDPIPDPVMNAYCNLIYDLLNIPDEPKTIYLSDEAQAVNTEFFYSLEPQLTDGLEDVESWAGKLHGQAARIAGIIHCCIHQEDATAELMSGGTMKAGIAIGEYFTEHAKFAFDLMGESDSREDVLAKYVLKRIDGMKSEEFSKRELHQLCKKKSGLKTIKEFNNVLTILINRGYLVIGKSTAGGRPSERVFLNPEYLSQKAQKAQKPSTQK